VATKLYENFFGAGDNSEERTGATLAVNLGAALALGFGKKAAAAALPGPGWLYVGTATVYDLAMIGGAVAHCMSEDNR
jgi:hypothetical protein